MFCWTCKHISPPGATYCAYCPGRRAFNCILCGGGHRCHVGTRTCPTCGSDEFSDHTPGLPTGWIAKGIVLALVFYLWRVGAAHGGELLGALWVGATHAFGFATGSDAGALDRAVNAIIVYGLLAWFFGYALLPLPDGGGPAGKFLRSLPVQVVRFASRWLPRAALLLVRGAVGFTGLLPKNTVGGKRDAPKTDAG